MTHATHSYTDLIARLRSRAWEDRQHRQLRDEAADVIERLSQPTGPGGEEKRRTAACVHACAGFVTEWLEQNEFWPFVLLTSDEYAELVIEKRKLDASPTATDGGKS